MCDLGFVKHSDKDVESLHFELGVTFVLGQGLERSQFWSKTAMFLQTDKASAAQNVLEPLVLQSLRAG